MNDSDLSFIRYASLLRVQQIHPLIDTIIGLLLVIGGILILGLVYGRISLSNRAMRVCLAVFSGALIIGGIDEIAVELLGQARADPVSLVEYVVALSVLTMTLVALPWFVFRATYAHRAIKALKGEIQTTGQMAQEVRAQQDELSRRYAASSAELARATAEAFRFEALVRSSQDAVVGVNEDGTIWHWNL